MISKTVLVYSGVFIGAMHVALCDTIWTEITLNLESH